MLSAAALADSDGGNVDLARNTSALDRGLGLEHCVGAALRSLSTWGKVKLDRVK